jgi:hypothetical protein
MKLLATIALLVSISLIRADHVFAHVFINDTVNSTGSILHISPDDDPIAGQTTEAFYDIQSSDKLSFSSATLKVIDTSQNTMIIPATISQGNVQANFIFPSQGLYKLHLVVSTSGRSLTFDYDQRVSRGAVAGSVTAPRHKWALAGLIGGSIALMATWLIALNYRVRILTQSKF